MATNRLGKMTFTELDNLYENHLATNARIQAHVTGVAERHLANQIDVSTGYTVKDDLDAKTLRMTNHVNGTAEKHKAEDVTLSSARPTLTATNVKAGLEQVDERVSNIIASSGTSSTEVVDARLSSTYGAFGTLKQRLDSADAKIKKTETPTTSTVSLTETAQVVSVTDSYNGIAEVEVGGATLNQVVVNGDFANGTTGWIGNVSTITANNKELTVTIDILTGNNGIYKPGALKNSGKYFVVADIYPKYATSVNIGLESNPQTVPLTLANSWNRVYAISTKTSSETLIVYHRADIGGYVVGDTFKIKNVLAIPITNTPYENYTADQMLALIGFDTYWEGLKSVERAELASRGRNLAYNARYRKSNIYEPTIMCDADLKANTTYTLSLVVPNGEVYYTNEFLFTGASPVFGDGTRKAVTVTTQSVIGNQSFEGSEWIIFKNNTGTQTSGNAKDLMITEGSSLFPYTPYDGSKLTVRYTDPTKFDGVRLPNGKQNEVNVYQGYPSAVKRVKRYVLQASDISQVATDSSIVIASTLSPFKSDFVLTGSDATTTGTAVIGSLIETNYNNRLNVPADGTRWYKSASSGGLRFIFPLGTTIEQARTALTGIVIYYQLATPITIAEEDFADYGIVLDGILTSNNDYTEFYVDNYNLFPQTTVTYPTNIAKAVDNNKGAIEGIRDRMDAFDKDRWIAPTLINSFVNVGGANATAGYYKDEMGVVRLRGRISTGSSGASPFTLPVGFRPSATKVFPIVSNNAFGYVTIDSAGVVTVFGNSTYYALESISFKAVTV